ncbi:amidohydrolase family protein [Nocardia vaccinii]|uniref:amidohydrolase family protein n=1 Tax=Nocardia vaccinii TaxID=1822 RepID=UPI00082E920E|nr:amidohydrolase family protein [Nocardia vaccinii]
MSRLLADGTRIPVIDASVHIFFGSNRDMRGFLREPFASRGIPDVEMDWYGAPGGEYAPGTRGPDKQYPGSDPELVGEALFGGRGVDVAVLHPMTRGILPDRYLTTAVLAAHNEMMVSRWLESNPYADRFRGTIRVNPEDITGALREIDRWASHPGIVQVGVPLQSRELYGKPQFWPLWEAAAHAGLPVAVHSETGESIAFPPTPSGHTRTYEQYLGFTSLNYIYHLMNMIAEGVFERIPELKFVWADGAADMLTPFTWRMDTFGRPHLEQTPWAPRMPSDYLPEHVYFVHNSLDGPGEVDFAAEWLDFTGKQDMVMFGSSYPHWHCGDIDELPSALTTEQREKVCWRNASRVYGIDVPAASATV